MTVIYQQENQIFAYDVTDADIPPVSPVEHVTSSAADFRDSETDETCLDSLSELPSDTAAESAADGKFFSFQPVPLM